MSALPLIIVLDTVISSPSLIEELSTPPLLAAADELCADDRHNDVAPTCG